MVKDTLSCHNPVVILAFYAGAVILGMFFIHPLFLILSCILSAVHYLYLSGKRGWRRIGFLLLVFVAISLLNPVFNTHGKTILFYLPGGRHYTREALFYGMASGAMFFTMLLWFASYSLVMTSDKLIYVLRHMTPALSLVITMTLRLIPLYQRKLIAIADARKCMGLGSGKARCEQFRQAGNAVLGLLGQALEGSVETADAMGSRGYGLTGRTCYYPDRFGLRDTAKLAILAILILVIAVCAADGAAHVEYVPVVKLPAMTMVSCLGLAAYGTYLGLPTAIHKAEDVNWHILKSKI